MEGGGAEGLSRLLQLWSSCVRGDAGNPGKVPHFCAKARKGDIDNPCYLAILSAYLLPLYFFFFDTFRRPVYPYSFIPQVVLNSTEWGNTISG